MKYFSLLFCFETAKDKIEKHIEKRQKVYVENKMFV